jgi:hypothetical protein
MMILAGGQPEKEEIEHAGLHDQPSDGGERPEGIGAPGEARIATPERQKIDTNADTENVDFLSPRVERAVFSGTPGRVLTDDEVNEILDFIVSFGYCPSGLSRRMELYYLKHSRLPERRLRIEHERNGSSRKAKVSKQKRDQTGGT